MGWVISPITGFWAHLPGSVGHSQPPTDWGSQWPFAKVILIVASTNSWKLSQNWALERLGGWYFFIESGPLPETNSLHLKVDGWNTSFLLGWPIFSGYVSFREGIWRWFLWTCINARSCWTIKQWMIEKSKHLSTREELTIESISNWLKNYKCLFRAPFTLTSTHFFTSPDFVSFHHWVCRTQTGKVAEMTKSHGIGSSGQQGATCEDAWILILKGKLQMYHQILIWYAGVGRLEIHTVFCCTVYICHILNSVYIYWGVA